MKRIFANILLITVLFSGYNFPDSLNLSRVKIPVKGILLLYNGIQVTNGGYGSSLAVDPDDSTVFYILTDRGPCVNSSDFPNTKTFVVPEYIPQIGKFKLENDSLKLLSVIELKDKDGKNLTGLPKQLNDDTLIIDLYGNKLEKDSLGIDPEGLVVLPDKSFWISDEYGPTIIHFDSTGRTIEIIGSGLPGQRSLPKVFARREPNGGMEGLTVTPDGKTLVGIMQSPLYNPTKDAVRDSKVTRLITYDIQSGTTKQYVYLLEETNTNLSDITAITDTTFLVLERDSYFLYGSPNSLYKSVYKINISIATDISDPYNSSSGKLIKSKTIEELEDESSLLSKGIKPVKKTLIVNLVEGNYYHDKPEGLAIINSHTIAISNDDDFGIEADKDNIISAKKIPTDYFVKITDYNEIVFMHLENSIYDPLTSVEGTPTATPEQILLNQNYPNPFNPATSIDFRISDFGFVTLKVYDVLGREVCALVNEEKPAGIYHLTFNAGNLSSGVYFYQLVTKNYISTKKMIIAE